MSRSRWGRRIERAGELEREHPAAAEPLRFYKAIAGFQRDIQGQAPDTRALAAHMPALLDLVRRTGPVTLAEAAARVAADPARWLALFDRSQTSDPADRFFSRVLLQSYTEHAATNAAAVAGEMRPECPFCGNPPIVAALRPEGDGGKRSLICSLCFTEWEFRRLLCPGCGEEDHQKLPIYTAAEFPQVRVEACDSCNRYIKAVNLTTSGLVVPEVDELAVIPLDLWADEHGYVKLTTNILEF